MTTCPCGSGMNYSECCEPIITGLRPAATAEELMRSRYTAYTQVETPYLKASLHPDHRKDYDEKSTKEWAGGSEWHKLEILRTEAGGPEDTEGLVEFIASFTQGGRQIEHHEIATFKKEEGIWYFVNGEAPGHKPVVRTEPKTGRNDPCPCGSGKKFKKCCG